MGAALLVSGSLLAQDGEEADVRIEPDAVDALRRMGDHLQSLQSFTIEAEVSAEVVLDTEQKVEIGSEVTYEVRRPDKLRMDLTTDVVDGELIYDGRNVIYAWPHDNVFAILPAPSTIKEILDEIAQKYQLTFPLADLFAWSTPDASFALITEGFFVGPAYVDGKLTGHWAFRSPDQDAEFWIAAEGSPLPLKVSLVDVDNLARPRVTAKIEWEENPILPPETFEFSAPEGAGRIWLPQKVSEK
ncbi:DUF2092 domain-containing protein [Neorhizobium sp. DT-125]|uniref:DUF2092 domain-containing protein n=1 Tax=Neorhizobium sp. DT-125 TaxID=3396163 RepID=UPI003F1CC04F